jgi:hypothetical protein
VHLGVYSSTPGAAPGAREEDIKTNINIPVD